jgi:hypothetical protein
VLILRFHGLGFFIGQIGRKYVESKGSLQRND